MDDVYALGGGYWVWRHRCPRGYQSFRQYHHTEERARGQASRHSRVCDSFSPFIPYCDILIIESPDWPAWIPQN